MRITTPIDKELLCKLHSGDMLLLSGIIYTARDAAHRKLIDLLEAGEKLPFNPLGAVLYYTGPSPTKPGDIVGSIGPTTSYRMDSYTPALLAQGVSMVIGKGLRGEAVRRALLENQAIYCAAYGGAGAYLASKVKNIDVLAFPELGPEAIYRLEVEDFPVVVINDTDGNDLYLDKGVQHG